MPKPFAEHPYSIADNKCKADITLWTIYVLGSIEGNNENAKNNAPTASPGLDSFNANMRVVVSLGFLSCLVLALVFM